MEKTTANNRIVAAGFGKRTVAFLIDFGIVFIASMILWNTVGSGPVMDAMGNKETINELYGYAEQSYLFDVSKNDNGEYVSMAVYDFVAGREDEAGNDQGGYGYELYLKHSFDAYTVFLADNPLTDREVVLADGTAVASGEYYTGLRFGMEYLGLPDPTKITDVSDEDSIDDEMHYFRWVVEDGAIDTDAMPVATNSALNVINDTSSSNRSETLTAMRSIFVNSDSEGGVYVDICNLALAQNYYASRYNGWLFNSWAAMAVFFLPLAFVWFFVIPLCFPDGETLGKKIMGLALVMKDGYALRWDGHLLHPFLIFLIVATAGAIPFNLLNQYVSLLMFLILAVIDYMVAFVGRDRNRTLTDRLSGTMVIDAKSSLWFANKETEEEYEKTHSTLRPKSAFFSEEQKSENARIALEDSILDLSTIDRHRKEAEAITSFDDFEKNGVDISNVDLDKKDEKDGEKESKEGE